jgi:hypothetical protein
MNQQSNLPTRKQIEGKLPWQLLFDVAATFYGGWAEIMVHGKIPGICHSNDINSAYPYIASRLPCIMHGKWEHRNRVAKVRVIKHYVPKDMFREFDNWLNWHEPEQYHNMATVPVTELPPLADRQIRFVYAQVTGSNPHIGTMLHRLECNGMSIVRPDRTRGYYWQHELEAAQRANLIDTIEYLEWWTYSPCKCDPPMKDLERMYKERLKVGKNTSKGKAYKLINSVYGKAAQLIGEPKFTNQIYASLITAGCRTMILNLIATHPGPLCKRCEADTNPRIGGPCNTASVATDSVTFLTEHTGITPSEELGGWDYKTRENLTLFKPGVYWSEKTRRDIAEGKNPSFKARGVNAKDFKEELANIDAQFERFDGHYPVQGEKWPSVSFPVSFAMTTAVQAIQQGNWRKAGDTNNNPVTQNGKPDDPETGKRGPGWFDGRAYRSTPRQMPVNDDGTWEQSERYTKRNAVTSTRPDGYVSPDGYIVQQIADALGIG